MYNSDKSASITPAEDNSDFFKRGNRVISLASGGAFLGVLVAQIPGAIVGFILAAIFAWFYNPQKNQEDSQN